MHPKHTQTGRNIYTKHTYFNTYTNKHICIASKTEHLKQKFACTPTHTLKTTNACRGIH